MQSYWNALLLSHTNDKVIYVAWVGENNKDARNMEIVHERIGLITGEEKNETFHL